MEPVLHSMREELRAIEQKLVLYRDSLSGTPYVIRLFPGMYLMPEGPPHATTYSARGITDGVMMYSAEGAARVVADCRKAYPDEFADCGYMHIVGALESERDELIRTLDLMESAMIRQISRTLANESATGRQE
jgi:hypothetical protein